MKKNNNTDFNINNVGEEVILYGWVQKKRNLGGLVFIDLRDRSGIIQIVVRPENENYELASSLKNESVIEVAGKIVKRESVNNKIPTGEIEVETSSLKLINSSIDIPFEITDDTTALEDTRLKYRYLDIRRSEIKNKLITRSKITMAIREFLDSKGFIEVETPVLCKSTPEGARDYLVPSRVNKGKFYALPQSPQLFKQLLMVGGIEKYFQIAKCFRDEDLRADRQPDFTQIDLEMSFLNEDQILTIAENLLKKIFKETINFDVQVPLRRMPYDEAVSKYGSDKPDTRFDMLLEDVKSILEKGEFEVYKNAKFISAIKVDGIAAETSRKKIDEYNLLANKFNMKSFGVFKVENQLISSSLSKFYTSEVLNELKEKMGAKDGDVIFVAAGNNKKNVYFGLGALREELAYKLGLIKPNTYDLLWVTKFPLFGVSEDGKIVAEHHPFTRPCDEDLDKLKTHPEEVYSYAYDIVINGYEAGGGTLRIFDQDLQKTIFEVLGVSDEDIEKKFGWFVEALKYGTPPHGGLAFGLDRLTMILSGTDNIRDVIAFPKNLSAVCPMTNAPRPVSEEQLKELGLKIANEEK